VAIGDLNGDGWPDLMVANSESPTVSVLLGNGDGTFAARVDRQIGSNPRSAQAGDLNGDGRLDLAVTGNSSVSVMLGIGDGTFGAPASYRTGSTPLMAAIGDLNADGAADLVTSNFYSNTVSVLLGDGTGAFGARIDYGTGSFPASVAIGDLDRDGRPDLSVANAQSQSVSVLLNIGGGDPTPVLLSLFEGNWASEGIELRWRFASPEDDRSAAVERSPGAGGPWTRVTGQRRMVGEATTLLDRGADPRQAHQYRLVVPGADGDLTFGPVVVTAAPATSAFGLVAVTPNPTRGVAHIDFAVARAERVRLSVIDAQGRAVARLVDSIHPPGRHRVVWDGMGARGRSPAGLYFIRYEWPGHDSIGRLLVVR
jgi:hypothetical protein